jgi:hypothetical protein
LGVGLTTSPSTAVEVTDTYRRTPHQRTTGVCLEGAKVLTERGKKSSRRAGESGKSREKRETLHYGREKEDNAAKE